MAVRPFSFHYLDVDDIGLLTEGDTCESANRRAEEIVEGRDGYRAWGEVHNCTFEFTKTGFMQFAALPSKAGRDRGGLITLGYALANGMKRANALQRLGRVSRGIPARFARILYYTCVVPSYLYAVDIFMKPLVGRHPSGRPRGSTGIANKLQKVHRQMAIFISGAMRTTATDVACVHAHLPPFKVLVNMLCQRATICMAMLPATHPLRAQMMRATHYVQRHRTPLHELIRAFDLRPVSCR